MTDIIATDGAPVRKSLRVLAKERTTAKMTAAAKALFAEVGYEKATIRAISKLAKMSTGAFFATWEDKAHCWREVMNLPVPGDSAMFRAGPDLLKAVDEAARQFRFYETQHRAKKTPDADVKAEVNRDLAERFEALIASAATPLPFEVAHAG